MLFLNFVYCLLLYEYSFFDSIENYNWFVNCKFELVVICIQKYMLMIQRCKGNLNSYWEDCFQGSKM